MVGKLWIIKNAPVHTQAHGGIYHKALLNQKLFCFNDNLDGGIDFSVQVYADFKFT